MSVAAGWPPKVARERRLLQAAIAMAGCVPVAAGAAGVLLGTNFIGPSVSFDSHYRYLSGLLLGIGLVWWVSIPGIERRSDRVLVLTFIVVVGGLGRLLALVANGWPHAGMIVALAMELLVTPAVCLWQRRVARLAGCR